MHTSPSTAIRLGWSGRQRAQTLWACFGKASSTPSSSATSYRTMRACARFSPILKPAAAAFWHRHGFVPINHLLTVPGELAHRQPDVVAELVRLFHKAKAMAPSPPHGQDAYGSGRAALAPAISLALRYALEQGLLPRQLRLADVWQGLSAEEGTPA